MKNKVLVLITGGILSISLTGCGSATQNVPMPNFDKPIEANKAIIEVERKSSFYGGARDVQIYDNGIEIGELSNDTKLVWNRDTDKLLCLSTTQKPNLLTASWLHLLIPPQNEVNCFAIVAGKVNKFEYVYGTGMFNQKDPIELSNYIRPIIETK